MIKHLFLFTIGPVQSFIEQARKTQDLYAGSFLLSDLIKKAIDRGKENGGNLIFPNLQGGSLPNRFLMEFENKNENELKSIGCNIKECIEKLYNHKIEKILKSDKFKIDEDNEVLSKAKKQYENHLEIFWLFQEFDNTNYKEAYKEIEQNLGAIKNIRTFSQNLEQGRKCSLCGERNVLFYRKNDNDLKDDKKLKDKKFIWDAKIYDNLEDSILQKGEGLCAVCIAKRKIKGTGYDEKDKKKFPSVSDIALYNVYNKLKEKVGNKQIEDIIDDEKYEPQDIFKLKDGEKSESKKAEELFKLIKDNNLKEEINPYYAVLIFDGDSMGEWMSGDNIIKGDLKEFHTQFAEKLSDFANKAKNEIVKSPKGKSVYAGGDDFLGFLNLSYLFDTLKDLRDNYIKKDDFNNFEFNKNSNLSFSAGIAIVHHKTPFSEALGMARKMEKKAKEIDGKDAFAIAVCKHSGEVEEFAMKFYKNNDKKESNLEELKDILKIITTKHNDKNQFSFNFVNVLIKEFYHLIGDIEKDNIIKSEIKRTVRNSCQIEDTSKEDKIILLSEKIIKLYDNLENKKEFFDILKILMFINRVSEVK